MVLFERNAPEACCRLGITDGFVWFGWLEPYPESGAANGMSGRTFHTHWYYRSIVQGRDDPSKGVGIKMSVCQSEMMRNERIVLEELMLPFCASFATSKNCEE
jgi:hypothetical protein